jgi:hypothetical protein
MFCYVYNLGSIYLYVIKPYVRLPINFSIPTFILSRKYITQGCFQGEGRSTLTEVTGSCCKSDIIVGEKLFISCTVET